MKLKVIVVDLELSPRAKRWVIRIAVPLGILGAAAVAYASVPVTFTAGQVLKAQDLNDSFNAVEADIAKMAPVGMIVSFAGSVDGNPGEIVDGGAPAHLPPSGWLLCNGEAVSRTTYANLFSALGVSFGGGDGVTTFNLPDYRGRFLRGVDNGAGRDPEAPARTAPKAGDPTVRGGAGNGGDKVGSLQSDAFGIHTHLVNDPGHSHLMSQGFQCGAGNWTQLGLSGLRTDKRTADGEDRCFPGIRGGHGNAAGQFGRQLLDQILTEWAFTALDEAACAAGAGTASADVMQVSPSEVESVFELALRDSMLSVTPTLDSPTPCAWSFSMR